MSCKNCCSSFSSRCQSCKGYTSCNNCASYGFCYILLVTPCNWQTYHDFLHLSLLNGVHKQTSFKSDFRCGAVTKVIQTVAGHEYKRKCNKKFYSAPVTVKRTGVLHRSAQRKSGFKQGSFEMTLESGNTLG